MMRNSTHLLGPLHTSTLLNHRRDALQMPDYFEGLGKAS